MRIIFIMLFAGSLDGVVVREKNNLNVVDLLSIAKQAAGGMAFLEQQSIVHRDLALRNLLAAKLGGNDKFLVKVSDFGLSRMASKGYYKTEEMQLPIKWSSVEAIEFHKVSSK